MVITPSRVAIAAVSVIASVAVVVGASGDSVKAASRITLNVDVSADRHAIDPHIYGVNFAKEQLARRIDLPVDRWGGDSTETYNWKLGSTNDGLNWYFENFADCWEPRFDYCSTGHDFRAYQDRIELDRRVGADTILTLPMLGWVAKDATYDQNSSCSFPTDVYNPQDDHDPYHAVCGNGQRNGQFISNPAPDPTRAGTSITPAFDSEWIADLVSRYGNAANGGVKIYELGNEPGLWNSTHYDFHPNPLTYDEEWSKSRDLASAIKQADPTAQVLGPAEWGWPSYFCSALDLVPDTCSGDSSDRAQHGGTALSAWYLQQFKAYQDAHGQRLLDYFDLHYYPQATYKGARYQPVTDVTRPLWDPSYKDPSWIDDVIKLIPRMHDWIDQNYPGTKLAITEYNMGLDVTKSKRLQNLIEADTLGIFGREGVDLATFWPESSSPAPGDAFALFRNYDGKHSSFGDVAVQSDSSNQGKLAVYAAQHGAEGALTVIVINKTSDSISSPLSVSGSPGHVAQVFRYVGHGIEEKSNVRFTSAIDATYPAQSVTLYAIAAST